MYVLNPMEQHGIRAGEEGVLILAVQISRQLATSFFQMPPMCFCGESAIRTFFVGHETRYEIMKGLMIELGYHYFSQLSNYEYKCMSLLNMIITDLLFSMISTVYKSSFLFHKKSSCEFYKKYAAIKYNKERSLRSHPCSAKSGMKTHAALVFLLHLRRRCRQTWKKTRTASSCLSGCRRIKRIFDCLCVFIYYAGTGFHRQDTSYFRVGQLIFFIGHAIFALEL